MNDITNTKAALILLGVIIIGAFWSVLSSRVFWAVVAVWLGMRMMGAGR